MIVYVVGNYKDYNTGRGGHYYSLSQMLNGIKKFKSGMVVSVGHEKPQALKFVDDSYHVHSNDPSCDVSKKIEKILIGKKVDLIHAYDYNSSITASILAERLNVPFLLTKCGGKPPRFYHPSYRNIVLFHEADKDIFNLRLFRPKRIEVIPNRVSKVSYDKERALSIFGRKGRYTFFKIGRIGKAYESSIRQAIVLVSMLNEIGFECQLFTIGYVENDNILSSIKSFSEARSGFFSFFTDERETRNAADLLGYCDAAIATGRGAMEAISAGKIVLFPCQDSTTPCILVPETLDLALRENFSERVVVPKNKMKYTDAEEIVKKISSSAFSGDNKFFTASIFEELFSIERGAIRLNDYYDSIIGNEINRYACVTPLGRLMQRFFVFVIGLVKRVRR
ncbi:MAG: hypothetical protein Q8L99_04325 [Polycyclovorans sp.]|nr:hypothetical protein [Polycyclovorans sp.]